MNLIIIIQINNNLNCLIVAADDEQAEGQARNAGHHLHSANSLFPSCLCSAVIQIINLLDDAAVSGDGCAVYEVAYQVDYCQKVIKQNS